ncbi:MAG: hypothetical protein AAF683_00050 [Pseudomonadota bacterium]
MMKKLFAAMAITSAMIAAPAAAQNCCDKMELAHAHADVVADAGSAIEKVSAANASASAIDCAKAKAAKTQKLKNYFFAQKAKDWDNIDRSAVKCHDCKKPKLAKDCSKCNDCEDCEKCDTCDDCADGQCAQDA